MGSRLGWLIPWLQYIAPLGLQFHDVVLELGKLRFEIFLDIFVGCVH